MARGIATVLVAAVLACTGCELVVDFDRSRIPDAGADGSPGDAASPPNDGGTDLDAAADGGPDAATDAGSDAATDAGSDAATDAGSDAATDSGVSTDAAPDAA
ncbi:MAG: hypothetical protein ACODAU_08735 [Myxococcota bacterium]